MDCEFFFPLTDVISTSSGQERKPFLQRSDNPKLLTSSHLEILFEFIVPSGVGGDVMHKPHLFL